MQKDEDYLLEPWIAYHGHLFGLHNLCVLDNGSTSPKTTALLADYESRGLRVCRSFSTREDYNRKGEIIGEIIKELDTTGGFDFIVPADCDEFLALRTSWGLTCQKESILGYIATLQGETRALRIPYQIINNPYEDDFYTYFTFYKTFFARGTFDYLDHGHHLGRTKGNPGHRDVDLVHIHFHRPPYAMLAERSRQKWLSTIKPENALADPAYDGSGVHLIPYFSMTEPDYWAHCMEDVQFYVPAFLNLLRQLGAPLVFPREPYGANLFTRGGFREVAEKLISASDRMDLGPITRTAMLVPHVAGEPWVKVYLEEGDYLRKHPDVHSSPGMTAMRHFCRHGYKEQNRVHSIRASGNAFPSRSGNSATASVMGLWFKP